MSCCANTLIFYGYKIPREIWQEGFNFCENNYKTNQNIPEDWDDYFIDLDSMYGRDEFATYFGFKILSIDDCETEEFDNIFFDTNKIAEITSAFKIIFNDLYMVTGYPVPTAKKYIGCRYW